MEPSAHTPIHYDAMRRRLWILGQRCHHGAVGALLALAGSALMAHDWGDRSIWFERGRQAQP
jgi:acyl dehydratase